MSRAVGYTRISRDGDASIQRQKRRISDYADTHDMQVVRIYDEGEYASGYDQDRTEYLRMLQDAESQNFDAVIVDDGNRLGRETKHRIQALYKLDEYGIEFHAAQYGYVDPAEPMEVLFEVFRATTDEAAKREEIEKSKEATQHRIEQGYDHGRPPYGFRYDEQGKYWVPGENFENALEAIALREEGYAYVDVKKRTGIAEGTLANILERREMYREYMNDQANTTT